MKSAIPKDFFDDTPCSVGSVRFPTGEECAVYTVDFGESRPPDTELFLSEQPFSLNVRENQGQFTYLVHGSKTVFIVGAEGSFQTPFFSSTLTVSREDHERFQKLFEKWDAWILIVRTSMNLVFIIARDGSVLCHYEQPRDRLLTENP